MWKQVYKKLRVDRIKSYFKECKKISERISEEEPALGFEAYLHTKERAKEKVKRVMMDIKEIKAS